jgi:phosphoglycolate phosphatase-like HAD superfamily hydrolase
MAYTAVLFDMDGVLLTGEHTPDAVYRRAIEEVLTHFDVTVDEDAVPASLVRPGTAEAFREGCRALDLPPAPAWGYREHASTVLANEHIDAGERTSYGDATVLAELADSHEVGVVSNNRFGTVSYVLRRFDWTAAVDAARARLPSLADYDRKKPEPDYLQDVFASIESGPADALFVGDRRSDVTTARRTGADAALLDRGSASDGGGPEPTYHLDSLHDLEPVVG